jgi:hypothetical protein
VGALGWRELVADVPPASRLDARDRQRNGRTLRHEHRQVDDPVLLGADQLFAVDDEHRPLAVVDDAELRDAAGGRDLGDMHGAGTNGVGERVVKRSACRRTQERIDRERVEARGRSERKRRQERVEVVHVVSLSLSARRLIARLKPSRSIESGNARAQLVYFNEQVDYI